MPLYDFTHNASLSSQQQDDLAAAITKIHTTYFTTPSFFVNVRFTSADGYRAYVGGKRKQANILTARVRTSPARKREMFDELCLQVAKVWREIVPENPDLRVFIIGGIIAGLEHGFAIPEAGKDKEWIKNNLPEFQKKADEGITEFQELIKEIKERGLID
ncbi:hypothetical protein F5X99DRAFT_108065 [Biscogniauxia marginata]|nr:hypothetical protein F5X99DRAFT_108065 [Biscogniauxia marginata]